MPRTTPQPRKSLGQHFLHDPAILRRIAEAAIASAHKELSAHKESSASKEQTSQTLLEIGAGPAGLTQALLEAEGAKPITRIIALERDKRFISKLEELAQADSRLVPMEADALRLSLTSLIAEQNAGQPVFVVGNLPYNISTKLLTLWLGEIATAHQEEKPLPASGFVLMFQEEVAQRILASRGDSHYGRLSVVCDWLCASERLFKVGRGAFTPAPKVDSAVVRLTPRLEPLYSASLATLEAITRAAFGTRRKMLRRALARLPDGAEPYLEATGLEGTERAEEVSLADFCAMARVLAERIPAP